MRILATGLLVAVSVALSGCGAPVTNGATESDREMFDTAREVNLSFKNAVAAVQLQLSGEAWESVDYGSTPSRTSRCASDEYAFRMERAIRRSSPIRPAGAYRKPPI